MTKIDILRKLEQLLKEKINRISTLGRINFLRTFSNKPYGGFRELHTFDFKTKTVVFISTLQSINETEEALQDLKQKKAQKKRDVDDKVTEVDEIRKELNRVNKVSLVTIYKHYTSYRNRRIASDEIYLISFSTFL